jgi:hypothetical protein
VKKVITSIYSVDSSLFLYEHNLYLLVYSQILKLKNIYMFTLHCYNAYMNLLVCLALCAVSCIVTALT